MGAKTYRNKIIISIHPPRVGRDQDPNKIIPLLMQFQSTLPVWGGTSALYPPATAGGISIHPPRVGRDGLTPALGQGTQQISIHPPRVGRDCSADVWACKTWYFNPPSPCGEGLLYTQWVYKAIGISIHPPRVGRDSKSSQKFFVNFCARR